MMRMPAGRREDELPKFFVVFFLSFFLFCGTGA
jgi:hypothetical protein